MQKLYYCILLSLADVTDAGATRALDAATPGARDADGQGQGPGLNALLFSLLSLLFVSL